MKRLHSGKQRGSVHRGSAEAAKDSLSREHWLNAARVELIEKGVAAVKVDRLARRLRVTRGSFYWHFKNHADLLRALLDAWEENNTRPFERAVDANAPRDPAAKFLDLLNLWIGEKEYSPAFDTAVRDWARISREAAAATRRADERRIAVLRRVFLELGFRDPEALVRARVTYYHQVGYYALEIREERKRRLALVPTYAKVLLGQSSDLINRAFAGSYRPATPKRAVPRNAR